MKRGMTLAVVIGLLMVCPLYANETDAACPPDDNDVAIAEATSPTTSESVSSDVTWCEFSCWLERIALDNYQEPYPYFWLKYDACVSVCIVKG